MQNGFNGAVAVDKQVALNAVINYGMLAMLAKDKLKVLEKALKLIKAKRFGIFNSNAYKKAGLSLYPREEQVQIMYHLQGDYSLNILSELMYDTLLNKYASYSEMRDISTLAVSKVAVGNTIFLNANQAKFVQVYSEHRGMEYN